MQTFISLELETICINVVFIGDMTSEAAVPALEGATQSKMPPQPTPARCIRTNILTFRKVFYSFITKGLVISNVSNHLMTAIIFSSISKYI